MKKNKLLEAKDNLVKVYSEYSKNIKQLEDGDLKRMKFCGDQLKSFEIKIAEISKALEELWKFMVKRTKSMDGEQQKEYNLACRILSKEINNYLNTYTDASSK